MKKIAQKKLPTKRVDISQEIADARDALLLENDPRLNEILSSDQPHTSKRHALLALFARHALERRAQKGAV